MELEDLIDPSDMPVCPLCEHQIHVTSTVAVIAVHSHLALAHHECVLETLERMRLTEDKPE